MKPFGGPRFSLSEDFLVILFFMFLKMLHFSKDLAISTRISNLLA